MSNIGRTRLVDGALYRCVQDKTDTVSCHNCVFHEGGSICRDMEFQSKIDCKPGEIWEKMPTHAEAWVGWHLDRNGVPAPMICDHNPGQLAHTTRYRFEIPQDVMEHLAGTRECLMLNKFGKMQKDCREEG